MAIHKLRALEYVVAVIEYGGFAGAARRLGVSAPSVHRMVTALERELGITLLDRDVSPMRATADSKHYVERARTLVREMQGLDASLRDRTSAPTGTIVVAAQSVVTEFFLAELLPRFHERFPGIALDLREAGSCRDLAQLDADALLQFGWPPPQEALLRTLAHTRWLMVAAPSFWTRHGIPAHPRDLANLPCVLFRTPYGEVLRQWTFVRGRERVDVDVDGLDDRRRPSGIGRSGACGPDGDSRERSDCRARVARWSAAGGTARLGLRALPSAQPAASKSAARQPRMRAFVEFIADRATALTLHRLPAGLPPVTVAKRPQWFKRRAG